MRGKHGGRGLHWLWSSQQVREDLHNWSKSDLPINWYFRPGCWLIIFLHDNSYLAHGGHQTGRRAFLMNFIVLHTDKDEKFWMNLIYQKCFFSIYEAVCVFRFLVCIYGIPVWISTVLLLRVSTHTYPWHTHTRAHLHCRVWIWSVVTVSVPRLLTGQSTRWAAMLNHTLHFFTSL